MSTIVLIPGAHHGGWYFDPVVPMLIAAGHRVIAPSLPGLDGLSSSLAPVNLATHVDFVTRLLEEQATEPVVLVGHSYGGAVITGAAARVPALVAKLVYLDAPVPADGQRVWDLIPEQSKQGVLDACTDGIGVQPPPALVSMDSRVRAHPIGTFLQPLKVQSEDLAMSKTFVVAEINSSYRQTYERLAADPEWVCRSLPCGHDFAREAPEVLAELLLEQAII